MLDEKIEKKPEVTLKDVDSRKANYRKPSIQDAGKVEELTHGSRTSTSDEPDSGHHGD